MAIHPIDLQTLLLRLGQIGKEQSAQRDALAQSQAVAGSHISQKSEQISRSVSETHILEQGPEHLNDEESGSGEESGGEKKKKKDQSREREIVKDPDLGQNIDITG